MSEHKPQNADIKARPSQCSQALNPSKLNANAITEHSPLHQSMAITYDLLPFTFGTAEASPKLEQVEVGKNLATRLTPAHVHFLGSANV